MWTNANHSKADRDQRIDYLLNSKEFKWEDHDRLRLLGIKQWDESGLFTVWTDGKVTCRLTEMRTIMIHGLEGIPGLYSVPATFAVENVYDEIKILLDHIGDAFDDDSLRQLWENTFPWNPPETLDDADLWISDLILYRFFGEPVLVNVIRVDEWDVEIVQEV